MDTVTSLIKGEMLRQYGSVRKFSETSGIPYSTLSNAIAKGFGGTAFDTVIKICGMLGIRQAYDGDLVLINKEFYDFYTKLAKLDEFGIHTVCTVMNTELMRCADENPDGTKKGFNGMGLASRYRDRVEAAELKELVKQIRTDEPAANGEEPAADAEEPAADAEEPAAASEEQ